MPQISGQDALFIHTETPTFKSHFTILTIYDQSTVEGGVLRYRDIVEYFDKMLSPMPVFHRKLLPVPLQLDSPYWIDDPNYHIEAHIRHIALPKPGDWRQFCILASEIQAMPIDMGKPLWDMHIIDELDNVEGYPEGSFAILTRLHHAVADGTTAKGIMMAMNQPAGVKPMPPGRESGVEAPGLPTMAVKALVNNTRQILDVEARTLRLLPVVGEKISDKARSTLNAIWPLDDAPRLMPNSTLKVPQTPFNAPQGFRRVFQMKTFPLAKIKSVRHSVPDATLNDVVLTVIGEAARLYLENIKSLPRQSLVGSFPINMREDKSAKSGERGNNISMAQTSLHTDEEDLKKRLEKIAESTRQTKEVQQAASVKELLGISKSAPNLLLVLSSKVVAQLGLIESGHTRMANVNVTNVPGPPVPLYFMGAKLLTLTGLAPSWGSNGLTFVVTSYCDDLFISFTGSPNYVQDPQGLADCLIKGFDALCEATLQKE
jgi:diacylglycerol O-acyltransferase